MRRRCKAAIAELRPPASDVKRVTASIGVAVFPDHGQELDDVVAAADHAMYQAKRDGRDRIAVAPLSLGELSGDELTSATNRRIGRS